MSRDDKEKNQQEKPDQQNGQGIHSEPQQQIVIPENEEEHLRNTCDDASGFDGTDDLRDK